MSTPEQAVAAARQAIDRGELDAAEDVIARGLRIAKQESETYWKLRVMRAEAFLTRVKWAEVEKELAVEPPPRYGRNAAAVQRLVYLAFATREMKKGKDKAREDQLLAAAERIASQHQKGMLPAVFRAKAMLRGSFADAKRSLELAQQYRDGRSEASARATLSSMLAWQGDFVAAVDMGEQALRLAKKLGLANVAQNAQGTLGWPYYELGDYDRAAELFTEAEAAAARLGNRLNRSSWLIQLGNVASAKRAYAGAERYNRQALEVATRDRERGFALANLARIALEQSQFDQARELNARAREAKRAADDEEALRSSDIVDARILAGRDRNYPEAEKLLRAVAGHQKSEHRLEAQTELAKLYVQWKPALAEKAFEEAVSIAHKQRSEIDHNELRLTFFNSVDDLYDAYVDFLVGSDPVKALEVAEESRAESLEEGRVATSTRFDARQIARENGATILAYWLGRKRSLLWVITPASIRLQELPADQQIEPAVESFQRIVRQGSPTSAGTRLYKTLVEPAKIVRGSRVIVIPDGRLHLLNFEMLQPASDRYWIEDVTVMNAPSLQLLATPARKRSTSRSPSLLLVGNPRSPDPVAYPPLKFAAGEMRAVGSRFTEKRVLEGANATPAEYRAASPRKFDYVHFAAHGVAGSQRPLDAFIQLTPGGESYKLVARDLQNDSLSARLVTIASCEGAGTRAYAGEGVVGLAWAFLHAGAERVIAALWKVDDSATGTMMDQMYIHIQQGQDPAAALRAAKLVLLRNPKTARPRYWAPFVLYAGN